MVGCPSGRRLALPGLFANRSGPAALLAAQQRISVPRSGTQKSAPVRNARSTGTQVAEPVERAEDVRQR